MTKIMELRFFARPPQGGGREKFVGPPAGPSGRGDGAHCRPSRPCRALRASRLVIAAGWAETNFGGHAVQWFGVEMPQVFPETGEVLQNLSTDVHMWLAYAMLAVAVGHVGAAFKHRWIDGHDVIRRMTFDGR